MVAAVSLQSRWQENCASPDFILTWQRIQGVADPTDPISSLQRNVQDQIISFFPAAVAQKGFKKLEVNWAGSHPAGL